MKIRKIFVALIQRVIERPKEQSANSGEEMEAMIAAANLTTSGGHIEHALLLFLYNTGARVSEATNLRPDDLRLGRRADEGAFVKLHGKGGKTRTCPLWSRTAIALEEVVKHQPAGCDTVFYSRHRKPYTRHGVYELVKRCAARVPALAGRKITPHVIRHATGCNLLRSGVDINTIRAWLGHANLATTNIYAEIDLTMKARATKASNPLDEQDVQCHWKQDEGLLDILRTV